MGMSFDRSIGPSISEDKMNVFLVSRHLFISLWSEVDSQAVQIG